MHTIPIDSADAREQRELEQARVEVEAAEDLEHANRCRNGWIGEDDAGRPRPCPRCKPALMHVACRTCGTRYEACSTQQSRRRGACCSDCEHSRRAPSPGGGT